MHWIRIISLINSLNILVKTISLHRYSYRVGQDETFANLCSFLVHHVSGMLLLAPPPILQTWDLKIKANNSEGRKHACEWNWLANRHSLQCTKQIMSASCTRNVKQLNQVYATSTTGWNISETWKNVTVCVSLDHARRSFYPSSVNKYITVKQRIVKLSITQSNTIAKNMNLHCNATLFDVPKTCVETWNEWKNGAK